MMSIDRQLLLIRKYDLWADISDEEYEELNVVHNFIEAPKGEYIYFEAFNHNKLYFIKEGYIRIGYIDETGKEIIREIIHKGEVFGQLTLEKTNLNGEFAKAYRSDVSLCAFTIDDFKKLLEKKPQLAFRFSRQVGAKLKNIENRLLNVLNKDVKTRLLSFLWQLVERETGTVEAKDHCIPNYLTHEDVASLIGSSRQTVTTMINELETEGILLYDRHQICFPDVKKVQKLLNVV